MDNPQNFSVVDNQKQSFITLTWALSETYEWQIECEGKIIY